MTLTAISSYESLALVRSEDSDAAPNSMFQFYQENELDQWSHELRLASGSDQVLRWIGGIFYFFEESDYQTVVRRTPAGRQPGLVGAPGTFNILPNTRVNQDNELYSLYGQFEWDIQEAITITYGVRWSHETKSGWNRAGVRCAGGAGGPPFCPIIGFSDMIGFDEIANAPALLTLPVDRLDISESITGHRFAFDWQATDNILAYASISRGFKSGGFSLAALQALTGLGSQPVKPEFIWAYEIGAKSSWLDDALQFNVSTFWYDWDDLQAFEPLFDTAAGFAVPQLVNVPKSRIYGADFEATWAPAEDWLIQVGLGLLDTKITDPGLVVSVSEGNELTGAPDLTFNGLLRKEFQIGPGRLALQATARFQDDVHYSITNDAPFRQSSIWLVGARGSYRFGSEEQYEIAVWGDNLTDEEYCMGSTSLAGLAESIQCTPSDGVTTYGLTVSVRYP
jgi:iron complex outermembrane receptor protein